MFRIVILNISPGSFSLSKREWEYDMAKSWILLFSMHQFTPSDIKHQRKIRVRVCFHSVRHMCTFFYFSAIHACVLMKTLIQNYVAQMKCPPEMLKSNAGGGMMSALSCMLCY